MLREGTVVPGTLPRRKKPPDKKSTPCIVDDNRDFIQTLLTVTKTQQQHHLQHLPNIYSVILTSSQHIQAHLSLNITTTANIIRAISPLNNNSSNKFPTSSTNNIICNIYQIIILASPQHLQAHLPLHVFALGPISLHLRFYTYLNSFHFMLFQFILFAIFHPFFCISELTTVTIDSSKANITTTANIMQLCRASKCRMDQD